MIDSDSFFRPKTVMVEPMTIEQIELVQDSFARVQPVAAKTARMFYQRLFAIDPSLRPMFRGDLDEQGRKLMQILSVAVNCLRHIEQVLPVVEEMGRRHARYGVRDEHYATVAAALLDTLEDTLGEAFTPETEQAWTAMYNVVAGAMRKGAATMAQAA